MEQKQWKPRNEHLHQVLMTRKSGVLQDKKGSKHQTRARATEEFREILKGVETSNEQ